MHMFTQNQNYLIYVYVMQQENNHPARRHLVYILAVLLPCVSGCGGGSAASAPPQINLPNPIAGGNDISGGSAEILFQDIKARVHAGFPLLRAIAAFSPFAEKFKRMQNYQNFLIQRQLRASPQDFQKLAISVLKSIISKIPDDIFCADHRQVRLTSISWIIS